MHKFLIIFVISILVLSCSNEETKEKSSDSPSIVLFDHDEVRYYERIYHKSYGDCSNEQDCAIINIEYPEIISSGVAYDSVNNYVQSRILSLPFNEDSYKNIDEISDSLFSEYMNVKKEFEDYHTAWYMKTKIFISGISNNILSLKSVETVYTGGANAFYNVSFANFDISTGKTILLTDIVTKENKPKIESIGKNIFYELKKIPANQSEEDAGYWFSNKRFELNDNFAITDSGLVFFYNLYEIASRAEGTTELFIPKEKLRTIVNVY